MTEPSQAVADLSKLPPPSSEEELRAWAWENEILPQLERSRIPERYRFEVKNWPEPRQLAAIEACEGLMTGNGSVIGLCSNRGTGKTTIAAQLIIRRLWREQVKCNYPYPWMPYRKLADCMGSIKALYAEFGAIGLDEMVSARDALCRASWLILDEIADFGDSAIARRMIQDICDRRYANRKDTILISNLEPEPFRKAVGESVISRMQEHGKLIPCDWKSFRIT